MAVFLAGVATAEIFQGTDLFATAKTLIDSSISIGVSAEDIRAGQGAKLAGKYFHSPTFDLKMNDAMFRLEYIAANVGSTINVGGDVWFEESFVASGTTQVLTRTAVPMTSGGAVYCYYRLSTSQSDKFTAQEITSNTLTGLTSGQTYCVKYLYTNAGARTLKISANFVPGSLTVYLRASLFAGDSSNPSTGTKVGTVTIKVPRFLLSGTQELSMSMTGASQTSFEGTALASDAVGCDGDAIYAEIIEVMDNARWYSDAKSLIIEDSSISTTATLAATSIVGKAPIVYAFYPNAKPKMISNAIITAQESNIATADKSKLVYAITNGTTALTIDSATGVISGTPAAGTAIVTVKAQVGASTDIAGMDASMTIVLS